MKCRIEIFRFHANAVFEDKPQDCRWNGRLITSQSQVRLAQESRPLSNSQRAPARARVGMKVTPIDQHPDHRRDEDDVIYRRPGEEVFGTFEIPDSPTPSTPSDSA